MPKAAEQNRTERKFTLQEEAVHAHRFGLGRSFVVKRREVSGTEAIADRHDW